MPGLLKKKNKKKCKENISVTLLANLVPRVLSYPSLGEDPENEVVYLLS